MPTTESSRKTLYLIDGSAYIYRAFFALPALNNSQGLQTNAILGFTTMLLKILRERKPDGLVVAFDEKGPTLRHAEFKAYKAQRPPMPEGMSAQIPYIHRVVDALNIPAVRQAGYEADDLIGTLAYQAEQAGFDVVIVTGDKDMFQLLTPHVRIYDPVKDKWFGEAECRERFSVEPARVVEIMGLMGDATDNIPGVKGIGEKTAMKLIAQFGTIEELLRRVEEVTPPRIKALLIEQAENARLSRRLATIQLDSPVTFDAATYHMRPPHQDQLTDLLRELEFTTLLKSFQTSFTHAEANAVETELVQDEPSAQRFVEGLPMGGALGLQCLLSPGPGVPGDVKGMALSTGDKTAFIPLDVHRLGTGHKNSAAPQSLFDEDPGSREEAAEAASVLAKLAPSMTERLSEQGSLTLFTDVEMPLVPVLAEIERNGFLLDVEGLRALSKELERELDRMIKAIEGLAGGEFNINSPKQLATVLFEKLGLKPIRKTKTGYSTDEDTLTQLATQHELPAQIVNYRSLSKLKSTYVDALPELVNPETKRLHTSLNQTVAATGRLSSTDPNLQNIPVKGEYGLRIREAFIAPTRHTLLCADYSQIEPRILAHLSQDPRLLAVFARGEDIHMATAMEIFALPSSQITRDMRRVAKTVVFGIVYGISPFGLASNIGVSQADAKKYIETFFEKFSAVRALMDRFPNCRAAIPCSADSANAWP